MKFLDETNIYVSSGNGGNGVFSFLNNKIPNGGNGGKGGDAYLICDKNVTTFKHLNYMTNYKAENGLRGEKNNKTGKNGKDLFIKVPLGTLVYDGERNIFLGKLEKHEEKLIIATGGRPGYGNSYFKKNYRKFEKFRIGGEQIIKLIHLKLNLIADVGLLGFPNTGKSSFINSVTNVFSKTGDYKFTTMNPILGSLKKNSGKKIIIADMPGILSFSSLGKGLGYNFLKHLLKTKLLLNFIDSSKIKNKYIFVKNAHIINFELLKFDTFFLNKKKWIIITKTDLIKNTNFINSVFFKKKTLIFFISIKKLNGIKKFIFNINEYFTKIFN